MPPDRDAGAGADAPRILLLAESLPYPTVKGGDLRTWQNLNALASCARVGIFGLCSNDRRRESVPDLALECWETSSDPALTIPPPKGVRLPARAWLLDPQGHPSDLYYSEGAARELSELLGRLRPDIVVLEGLWLHRYLGVIRGAGCRVILDCHNVEAALAAEVGSASRGDDLEARVRRDILPARTEVVERRAVGAVHQLWACSDEDERRLRDRYHPVPPVVVVPNGVRLGDYDGGFHHRPGDAPPTLVFPGFFGHFPNVVAARFLTQEVFPRLAAAAGDWRLVLVGAMPPPELEAAAANDPRIVVTGAVRDVRPYLAGATAMAVPLFHGGGTRYKILEGFAAGLPVISTAKGVEGLGARDRTHLLLAETADEFVAAAVALFRDPDLARCLSANARAWVAERFSWDAAAARIRSAIAALEA